MSSQVGAVLGAAKAAAPTALTALKIVSGVASAFGALGQIRAGQLQAQSLLLGAELETLQARQELVRGKQDANDAKERMLKTLSQNIAAFGASGVDIGSSGTARNALIEARKRGEREQSTVRANADIRSASRQLRARQIRIEARAAKLTGQIRGVSGLLRSATDLVAIGAT